MKIFKFKIFFHLKCEKMEVFLLLFTSCIKFLLVKVLLINKIVIIFRDHMSFVSNLICLESGINPQPGIKREGFISYLLLKSFFI